MQNVFPEMLKITTLVFLIFIIQNNQFSSKDCFKPSIAFFFRKFFLNRIVGFR